MSKNELFVAASRNKFRFPFRGMITTEDLWDLKVEDLDAIYKTLNSQSKKAKEESLLNTKTTEDKQLDMKIDIIKYIVSVKQEEAEKRKTAKVQKEKRELILGIMAEKQNAELHNKSPEELQAMLDAMSDENE